MSKKKIRSKLWVCLFGGYWRATGGGLGWTPSMFWRVVKYYRESWHKNKTYSLWRTIWFPFTSYIRFRRVHAPAIRNLTRPDGAEAKEWIPFADDEGPSDAKESGVRVED